jgi:ATP-dependent DNA helicase RecG
MSRTRAAPGAEPALTTLVGVGPARAAALARLGLVRVRDLLLYAPRRLVLSGRRVSAREAAALAPSGEDERELGEEAESASEVEVALVGTLRGLRLFRAGRGRSVLALELCDASGALRALFFNQPWQFERLRALAAAGRTVELVGRLGRAKAGPALLAPRVIEEPPATRAERLVPVYPNAPGLGRELFAGLVEQALARAEELLVEPLDAETLAALDLPLLAAAARAAHRPATRAEHARALRRLAFERLLALQARLARTSAASATARARAVVLDAATRVALLASLPFRLTAGQTRVLDEVVSDLARPRPMRRLLQGEVGAGKTAVALLACAAVARAGGQAALLAPTELLAEQHELGLAERLAGLGLRAVRLTGSLKARARAAALAELESGRAQLAIGTHALLAPEVRFARLDLCVIDEQQRFGVAQKQALLEKGARAHALLLSATPIPRTLALCYYGDLDASRLAERPPGRGALETRVVSEAQRGAVEAHVLARARAGERAFWVCPRILEPDDEPDASGADDLSGRESRAETVSAERTHARLVAGPLAGVGLALLHGRLAPERRAAALARFRAGTDAVLVATSMIEVGVDVPEATVMVIEAAERFGLAQLHQLRGRIGRSQRAATCFLFGSAQAAERLRFLERCNDGFELSEEDLRRRGMGDLAGLRQAGLNLEGLGGVLDLELVQHARALVRSDPELCARYVAEGASAALV